MKTLQRIITLFCHSLIVGKSGCGKTTLLLNLLQPGWLDCSKFSDFVKSLFQPECKIL